MISSSIGFRVEGVAPVDIIDSRASVNKESTTNYTYDINPEKEGLTIGDVSNVANLLLGVFDITDNDYVFYRDQINAKGTTTFGPSKIPRTKSNFIKANISIFCAKIRP